MARAFATATQGRPGPVVLSLPEDMLTERVACADARRYRPVQPAPPTEAMAKLADPAM